MGSGDDDECVFGVDEAGRGPVLGSLFVGFVEADPSHLPDNLRDSKDLTNEQVDSFSTTLRQHDGIRTHVIELPADIVGDSCNNVTSITVDAMTNAIANHATTRAGFIDACHSDPDTFKSMLEDQLPDSEDLSLTVEHEADDTYPIVMAAGILAKDARETHVTELQNKYGDIGSGYPSDQRTLDFLTEYVVENGSLPPIARESWGTSQDILTNHEQRNLADFS